jgi:uncharacterized repeat protein (TIGR04052 family)
MKLRYGFTAILLAGLGFAGCGDDNNDNNSLENEIIDTEKEMKNISINFEAFVGDEILRCSDENNNSVVYQNVGLGDNNISIRDFRFFVSEIEMIKQDGTSERLVFDRNNFQYEENGTGSAILDFEDGTGNCKESGNSAETHKSISGQIPDGDYVGMKFYVGVPFDINHKKYDDIFVQSKMDWNWAGGRKFTKFEAIPSESNVSFWTFHLGSTGCVDSDSDGITNECSQPNRVPVEFNNFDIENDTVKIDYAKLFDSVNLSEDNGGAKGCMSALTDPECKPMFEQIGIDVDALDGISTTQYLFYK